MGKLVRIEVSTRMTVVVGSRRRGSSILAAAVAMLLSTLGSARGDPGAGLPEDHERRKATELLLEADQLREAGKYSEAASLAAEACKIREDVLGESLALANCLSQLGLNQNAMGRYADAQANFERALRIRRACQGPNHLDVATELNNLALAHGGQGQFAEEIPLYERALSIYAISLPPDDPLLSGALNNLAIARYRMGAYDDARPIAERAVAIRTKHLGQGHHQTGTAVLTLTAILRAQGRYTEAEVLLEDVLSAYEKSLGESHPTMAFALLNLAQLHVQQGDFSKPQPLLERALAIREATLGPDHPYTGTILDQLGQLHLSLGNYDTAQPLFERGVSIAKKNLGPRHIDYASAIHSLARLHSLKGNHSEAETLYRNAIAIAKDTFGSDHPHVAVALQNLASAYHAQGAFEEARSLLEEAQRINEERLGVDHPQTASTLSALAEVARERAEYGEAEALARRALSIRERTLGLDHSLVAESLSNLGITLSSTGAYDEARLRLERALDIRVRALGSKHPNVAIVQSNLAWLSRLQDRFDEAESLYRRSLAIDEEILGPGHPNVAIRLGGLASVHYAKGELASAAQAHGRALEIEDLALTRTMAVADEPRRLSYASKLSRSTNNAVSTHVLGFRAHVPTARLALTTVLRRKGRAEEMMAQANDALRRTLSPEDKEILGELDLAHKRFAALSTAVPRGLTIDEFEARLGRLRQEQDALWHRLASHSRAVRALRTPVTIESVQATLPPGGALIELVHYAPRHDDAGRFLRTHDPKPPARYAAYLVFPGRFDWVDLGPAAPIDAYVTAFRRALQLEQPIPTDLRRAVMEPIRARLPEDTRRLVIAPDGALNLVPFGALFDGERYLVERYALRYVTTGRDLLPPLRDPVTTTPVTVVANPLGADLSGAELEADVLAGLFPDVRMLRQADATETNLRTVERPLVLHMATHGFFGPALNERDNPMLRSGIHLADVDQLPATAVDRELDDGRLTAYEVSGWDLRGTQLVVLSACETGLGALHMGEGVLGLRRAFSMAGAQTQVMSLWQVGDVTTQKLMTAYYHALAGGMGRGEAMQAVQLEMLRTKEHRHPHHWAAFVVTGDDAPMAFPAGQEPTVAHDEDLQPGPPPHRARRGGCSMASTPSDGGTSATWLLLFVVLGPTARRRRPACSVADSLDLTVGRSRTIHHRTKPSSGR